MSCGTALSEGAAGPSGESDASLGTTRERPPVRATPANADSNVDERKLKAFRRRLDPYLDNGWEIRNDDGDGVELTYRDFGSVGIHVALVLFVLTMVWGNALYALYGAIVRRNSATLHADDDPRRWPAQDPRPSGGALRWMLGAAMGLVTLLAVQVAIGDPTNPISWSWLVGSVTATASLVPPVSRRLRDRGSLTEFGWQTETAERLVHDAVQCTVCSSFVDVAVERTFEKYLAVAGFRVTTAESGENYYCEECCETALSTSAYRELSELLEGDDADSDGTDRGYASTLERD